MFDSTHPFAFFDYFRVPYQVVPGEVPAGCGRLRVTGGDATFTWVVAGAVAPPVAQRGRYRLDGLPFFGSVVPDRVAKTWLHGTGWRPVHPITDHSGRQVASIWLDSDGSVFLPFDPGELMHRFWSEAHQDAGRSAQVRRALVRLYYAIRPVLPRPLQLALRRRFTTVQQKTTFPNWPVEPALHDLYDRMFDLVARFAGVPVPWLDLWPDGHDWALVLTHDVETADGCATLDLLRDIEREFGERSSWNFVPLRYHTDDRVLDGLRAEGCEIGVHGLLHDGRDLASLRMLNRRLPEMRRYAKRWGAVGFRSPATQRNWDWMPLLGFDYDTSYHDTAPYEPRPGGSCSYYPYFIQDTVELPITLPQDHTLFAILQHPDEKVWIDKAATVRARRGMVLVLTHPDYATDPRVAEGYRRLLKTVHGDTSAWRALPREVSAWWRERARSGVERVDDKWRVTGPAAGSGRVAFAQPPVS
jgi:hypothetical protein